MLKNVLRWRVNFLTKFITIKLIIRNQLRNFKSIRIKKYFCLGRNKNVIKLIIGKKLKVLRNVK